MTIAPRQPLTAAELRALDALARYATAHEASVAIGVATQTLRNEAQSAYRKLQVSGKTEAFRAMGWLRPPSALQREPQPVG